MSLKLTGSLLEPGMVVKAANTLFRYLLVEDMGKIRFVTLPHYRLTTRRGVEPDELFEVLTDEEIHDWLEYVKTDEWQGSILEASAQLDQMGG